MRKQDLQKEKLDQIGRRLLETVRIQDEEIERIIAAPQLFDAVKARIKAEHSQKKSKNVFVNWRDLPLWNWQRIILTTASFAILAFCISGLIVFSNSQPTIEQVAAPKIKSPGDLPEIELQPEVSEVSPEIAQTELKNFKTQVVAKRASLKNDAVKKRKQERKTNSVRDDSNIQNQPGGEFYALDHVGNPNEIGVDLRIVRTEISRAQLFALGVNVPIENESGKIKTDLLVGSDGVARAIRFIE